MFLGYEHAILLRAQKSRGLYLSLRSLNVKAINQSRWLLVICQRLFIALRRDNCKFGVIVLIDAKASLFETS